MTSLHIGNVFQCDHRYNLENVIIDANRSFFNFVHCKEKSLTPYNAYNSSYNEWEKHATSVIKETKLQKFVSESPNSIIHYKNEKENNFPEIICEDRLRLTSKLRELCNFDHVDESENETTHVTYVEPKEEVANPQCEEHEQSKNSDENIKTKCKHLERSIFNNREESELERALQESRSKTEKLNEEELLQSKQLYCENLSEEISQEYNNELVTVQTKELWQRFQEQMEVHRALSEAIREIERVSKEITLIEVEKETNRVVESVWRSLQEKTLAEQNVNESVKLHFNERYKGPFAQATDHIYNRSLEHKRDSNNSSKAQIINGAQKTLQITMMNNKVNTTNNAHPEEEEKQNTKDKVYDCQCTSKTELILANAFRPELSPQPYTLTRYYPLREKVINELNNKENTLLNLKASASDKKAIIVRTTSSVVHTDCIDNNNNNEESYIDVETNYEDDNDFETPSDSSLLLSVDELSIIEDKHNKDNIEEEVHQTEELSSSTSRSEKSSFVTSRVSSSAWEESINESEVLESKSGRQRSKEDEQQYHQNKHLPKHNVSSVFDDNDDDDIVTSESAFDTNTNVSIHSVYDKNGNSGDSSHSVMDECITDNSEESNIYNSNNNNNNNGIDRKCNDESNVTNKDSQNGSNAKINNELLSSLRAFQSACTAVNELTKSLIQSSQPLEIVNTQEEEFHEPNTEHNTECVHNSLPGLLTRDIRDIQYLHRFLVHIQKRVKLLDLHNNAQRVKYKLLKDAQILCKARCELQHKANNRNRTKQAANARHKRIADNNSIYNKNNRNIKINDNKVTRGSTYAANTVNTNTAYDEEEVEEEESLHLLDDAERHRLHTLLNAHLSHSTRKSSINDESEYYLQHHDDNSLSSIDSMIDELSLMNEIEEESSNHDAADNNEMIEEEEQIITDDIEKTNDNNKPHINKTSHYSTTKKHLQKINTTFSNSVDESIGEEIISDVDTDIDDDHEVDNVLSAYRSLSDDVITEDISLMNEVEEFEMAGSSEDVLSTVDEEFAERLVNADSFHSIIESIPTRSHIHECSRNTILDDSISEENNNNNNECHEISLGRVTEDECISTETGRADEETEEVSRNSTRSLHSIESDTSTVNTEHSDESAKKSLLQEASNENNTKIITDNEQESIEREEKDIIEEYNNKQDNIMNDTKMELHKLAITTLNMSAEERTIFETNVMSTKQRRQEALRTVNIPSLEYLYNANIEHDEIDNDSNQKNREISISKKKEEAAVSNNELSEKHFIHDSESHNGNADDMKSVCVWQGYSEEGNAMQKWKDAQINLIHTITKAKAEIDSGVDGQCLQDRIISTIKVAEGGCTSSDEACKENEEHWEVLEKLIESKLGSYTQHHK